MGQKINPHELRVGIMRDWESKWYPEEDWPDDLCARVKSKAKYFHNEAEVDFSAVRQFVIRRMQSVERLILPRRSFA